MQIKGIIDCDLVNYKEPCLTVEMPKCDFKCDRECGSQVCQNSSLAAAPIIDVSIEKIIKYFDDNPVTKAICFQGLEPFDTFDDLLSFIKTFRVSHNDFIIIYTGYYASEILTELDTLQ